MRGLVRRAGLRGSAAVLGAAVILCGCGSGEAPTAAARPAKGSPAAPRRTQAAPLLSPDMVGAVSAGGPGPPPVQVKFELRQRPGVAQSLDIDLAIVPASSTLDRVYGKVEAGEGLELASGGQIEPTERPVEGVPILHSIKVLPKRDGIFTVNAIVSVESGGQSSSQTFAIPVIVGGGLPEAPPRPGSAKPTTAAR